METGKVIGFGILLLLAIATWLLAVFQYREKGPLLNNSYLYASAEERRRMNKKPYYRQSAIVFFLLGFSFLMFGVNLIAGWSVFMILGVCGILGTLAYAVISSVLLR